MKRKIVERGAYGLSALATKLETDNRTSTAVGLRDERTTLQQYGASRREDDAVVGKSPVSARALRQVFECRRYWTSSQLIVSYKGMFYIV